MPIDNYERVTEVYAVGDKYNTGDFQVYHTGSAAFMEDNMALSEQTMKTGETVGIGVALVVLALVFGALTAALLPVLMAIGAIVIAFGLYRRRRPIDGPDLHDHQHDNDDGPRGRHRLLPVHPHPLP